MGRGGGRGPRRPGGSGSRSSARGPAVLRPLRKGRALRAEPFFARRPVPGVVAPAALLSGEMSFSGVAELLPPA